MSTGQIKSAINSENVNLERWRSTAVTILEISVANIRVEELGGINESES